MSLRRLRSVGAAGTVATDGPPPPPRAAGAWSATVLASLGVAVLCAAFALGLLGAVAERPRLVPVAIVAAILLPIVIARPRWIVPVFIALAWTTIGRGTFGGIPTPVELGGPLLILAAIYFARERLGIARDALVICALLTLAVLISALASADAPSLPTGLIKDLSFLLIAALCVRGRGDLEKVAIALAIVAVFLGVGAVWSMEVGPTSLFKVTDEGSDFYNTTAFRAAGTFGDPNFFALAQAALLPFALWLVTRGRWKALLGLIAVVCIALGIFETESRGGMLAFGLALVAFGFAYGTRRAKFLAIGVVVAAAIVVPTMSALSDSINRPVEGRATENLVAVHMALDHPVAGVGFGQYPAHYRDYTRHYGDDPRTERQPHSLPLQIAAEEGLIGIVAWLAAGVLLVRYIRRTSVWDDLLGRSVVISVAAYLAGSLLLHGGQIRLLFILVGLLLSAGVAEGLPRLPQRRTWPPVRPVLGGRSPLAALRPAFVVMALILVGGVAYMAVRPVHYVSSATLVLTPADGVTDTPQVLAGYTNSGAGNNLVEVLDSDDLRRSAGVPDLDMNIQVIPEARAITLTATGDSPAITQQLQTFAEAALALPPKLTDVWRLQIVTPAEAAEKAAPADRKLAAAIILGALMGGIITLLLTGRFGDGVLRRREDEQPAAPPPARRIELTGGVPA